MMRGKKFDSPRTKRQNLNLVSSRISTIDFGTEFSPSQSRDRSRGIEKSTVAFSRTQFSTTRFVEVDEAENFKSKLFLDLKSGKIKNDLNQHVYIENQLLQNSSANLNSHRSSYDTKAQTLKVQQLLRTANKEIQLVLYKVNRCVDTGNFH